MSLEVTGPTVGAVAPDLALVEADGAIVQLAALHGHAVVLVFYRGGW
jgi:peroxiredoxin